MAQPAQTNPPVDYVVAALAGLSDEELLRGLDEGWIRRPPGAGDDDGVPPEGPPRRTVEVEGIDRATLRRWVGRLDASLDEAAFDAMWRAAGPDDAARGRALARFVAGVVGLPDDGRLGGIDAALAAVDGRARIVRLDNRTGRELEALAAEEGGVRRALVAQSRWAVVGERRLDTLADPTGRYDRYDPDSGEQVLSDAWLGDRARHASWRWAGNRGIARSTPGDGWRFVDRAAGPEADVDVASAGGGPVHQVVFARDGGDRVTGGATTDRLHGGDGDDVLRGRGGDDLLEGNAGDDALAGGAGRDDIAGGRGNDELDGGAGSDRLDGGAGDDELTGGRGTDLLRGGKGHDTYVFERGDGADVIEDDDGTLMVDGTALRGTMQRDGDAWVGSDGLRLRLDGPAGAQVLRVTTGTAGDGIALRGWTQGSFGITLQGLGESGATASSALDAVDVTVPEEGAGPPLPADGPHPNDPFGNEGSTGLLPEPPEIEVSLEDLLGPTDPSTAGALVDWTGVHAALASWGAPAPPDVPDAGSVPDPVATGVSASALAEALADADGAIDDGAGATAVDALANASPWWRDQVSELPLPPVLSLRRASPG